MQIVLAGDAAGVRALERAAAEVFLPARLVARAEGAPRGLASLMTDRSVAEGAAAFVCRGQRCDLPEHDPARLREALGA